jgi:hypothetical protein
MVRVLGYNAQPTRPAPGWSGARLVDLVTSQFCNSAFCSQSPSCRSQLPVIDNENMFG